MPRFTKLDVLSLTAIFVVGLLYLPYPFGSDQALFTVGAAKLSTGAVLYRDFWDTKPPGIFGFYLLAGKLFGFNEVGIHTLEVLYMTTFAAVLVLTLKTYYKNPPVAAFVPLLTMGMYYGTSERQSLTQADILVGFPLFLALWFALRASQQEDRQALWSLLSGVMGGLAVLFKLVFFLIPAGFWFVIVFDSIARRRKKGLSTFLSLGVPVVLGWLIPLVAVAGYCAWQGTLTLLSWTLFVYPSRIAHEIPCAPSRLFLMPMLDWFTSRYAVLMSLSCLGAYVSLSSRRDLLTLSLAFWLLLGFVIVFLPCQFRWHYYFLLLSVPLGILSAQGLDVLWEQAKGSPQWTTPWRGQFVAISCLALLFSPILLSWGEKALLFAYASLSQASGGLTYEYRYSYGRELFKIEEDVAFLSEPDSLPGGIFALATPLYYILSGRDQTTSLSGWSYYLLSEQWSQLSEELIRTRPPYIFIATECLPGKCEELLRRQAPQIFRLLKDNYQELRRSAAGVWYVVQNPLHVHP